MKLYGGSSYSKLLSDCKTFLYPKKELTLRKYKTISSKRIAILIPSYNPTYNVYLSILAIHRWVPDALVLFIDDCTPVKNKSTTLRKIKNLSLKEENVIYLRTPQNMFKAGALNYGIEYLMYLSQPCQIVFTFDDDVKINRETIPLMAQQLYAEKHIGAVCSKALVSNKNKNLLTRLQGLEYHSFNVTKIADNGFLSGPLVMQGMLTAFRMSAIKSVRGYHTGHLIEDYDITVRLKNRGWRVKIAFDACAWTEVPETVSALWKQRVRWTLGGLQVVFRFRNRVSSIFQDLIGHFMFISLFVLIFVSLLIGHTGEENPYIILTFVFLSVSNFLLATTFSMISMKNYPEKDWKDWVIKFSIIPELFYSTLLSFVLIGSYIFAFYLLVAKTVTYRLQWFVKPFHFGLRIFRKLGYSLTWGTKNI